MARNFNFGGVVLPLPQIKSSIMAIKSSDSGRTLGGKAMIKCIAQKVKLECTWRMLEDPLAALVVDTLKRSDYADVSFPDVRSGSNSIKNFYSDDPQSDMMAVIDGVCYWNVSITLEER